jgi:hypothetical protein
MARISSALARQSCWWSLVCIPKASHGQRAVGVREITRSFYGPRSAEQWQVGGWSHLRDARYAAEMRWTGRPTHAPMARRPDHVAPKRGPRGHTRARMNPRDPSRDEILARHF